MFRLYNINIVELGNELLGLLNIGGLRSIEPFVKENNRLTSLWSRIDRDWKKFGGCEVSFRSILQLFFILNILV